MWKLLIDIPKPKYAEQYRFHFDATACIGCHCCEVACNEQNNNSADVKWRRVGETQSGIFPKCKKITLTQCHVITVLNLSV